LSDEAFPSGLKNTLILAYITSALLVMVFVLLIVGEQNTLGYFSDW
jgi:preprotein translocase subunit SecG